MASIYQETQRKKQLDLMCHTELFDGDTGGAYFMGKQRGFVLNNGDLNLYAPIRESVKAYFSQNSISWWQGSKPTGHILSSQTACLNHLFPIRDDKNAVLSIIQAINSDFVDVLPVPYDKEESYISFEVVSGEDYLNEKQSTRGSQCTSIDALIYAKHRNGETWIIPIEWKYTEFYNNQDKSSEDRQGAENRRLNGKGLERLNRYSELISYSSQLKSLDSYEGSIYFQEPFYQLMRQTLWAEQVIAHAKSNNELFKACNYLHIHVIPSENRDLLQKKYRVSEKEMEETWRSCIVDQSRYKIIEPHTLLSPITERYPNLESYLAKRYW